MLMSFSQKRIYLLSSVPIQLSTFTSVCFLWTWTSFHFSTLRKCFDCSKSIELFVFFEILSTSALAWEMFIQLVRCAKTWLLIFTKKIFFSPIINSIESLDSSVFASFTLIFHCARPYFESILVNRFSSHFTPLENFLVQGKTSIINDHI